MTDLDAALATTIPEPVTATTTATPRIIAIDPGTHVSAWARMDAAAVTTFGICDNLTMRDMLRAHARLAEVSLTSVDAIVIERVESFGMAVGAEVFETVFWAGRFAEVVAPLPFHRIGRKAVKLHLCGSPRAKDPNIRQAIIDRFGGPGAIKRGGALHGVSKDVWAAIAVGLTWLDREAA